jgi:hypothetical protein
MLKSRVLGALAALGLMAAPAVPSVSIPTTTPTGEYPSAPAAKTDGRHSKTKRDTKRPSKRRRATIATRAIFGAPAPWNTNRFARRAVIKAGLAGKGRMIKDFGALPGHASYMRGSVVSTARARANREKLRTMYVAAQGRATAARVLASAEVMS